MEPVFLDSDVNQSCFEITIENDAELESLEDLTVDLSIDRRFIPNSAVFSPNWTTINIVDDDGTHAYMCGQISAMGYEIATS